MVWGAAAWMVGKEAMGRQWKGNGKAVKRREAVKRRVAVQKQYKSSKQAVKKAAGKQ